jgi:DNA polymerase-3 subunit gamma/tau
MSYVIYARKYRPNSFEEMIGQKAIVQTLQNAIKSNRVAQAYIFSGMRGVGKTTAARILAKSLNCQYGPTPNPCNKCESCVAIKEDRSVDVLEIDGASSRTVEDISPIRDTAKYRPIHSRYKVIIIDEVHMLSTHAFNALLKTLEEPPEKTMFIFATTEFHKVPATIVSRCQQFEFRKISQRDIINHLIDIAEKENLTISPYGLKLIAEAADGSLRDAQSLLDQAVAFSGESISDDDLKEILGAIGRDVLFECSTMILEQNPARAFSLVDKIIERGYDLRFFSKELIQHFRNLLLAKSVKAPQELLPLNPEELVQLKGEADKASPEELLRCLTVLQQAEPGLRYSSHPQIYLESLLVRLCHFKKIIPLQDLISEVEKLKKEAGGLPPVHNDSPRPFGGPETSGPGSEPERLSASPETGPRIKPKGLEEKEAFRRIVAELQQEKSSLAAVFSRLTSFRIYDETMDIKFHPEKRFVIDNPVIIEVSFPAGEEYYHEALHRDIRLVERIASGVIGQKVKLKLSESIIGRGSKSEKQTELALKDPSVQAFMNTFKGTIVSVEPVKRTKERE